MKTALLVIFIISQASFALKAQVNTEIEGQWLNALKNTKIEIYKQGNKFFGKLIWLKDNKDENGEELKDVNNPDIKLRDRPLIGIDLYSNLEFKEEGLWRGGVSYDPKSGRTYNCQMAVRNDDELDIRTFYGLTLLGKTETWTKVAPK